MKRAQILQNHVISMLNLQPIHSRASAIERESLEGVGHAVTNLPKQYASSSQDKHKFHISDEIVSNSYSFDKLRGYTPRFP